MTGRDAALAQYACDRLDAARSQYEDCVREPLGSVVSTVAGRLPETGMDLTGQLFAAAVLILCGVALLTLTGPWVRAWAERRRAS